MTSRLTNHVKVSVANQRWIGGNLALVQAHVGDLGELDLELPVVGLLVDDLKPGVAAVGLSAVRQEVRISGLVNSFQPRNLQENQFKKKR